MTRQLVLQMMDRKENGTDTPGLLTKLMGKLEKDLDSTDEDLRHKSIDKIIKLLPYVIAKEKSPAVQLNVQNNNVGGPQVTAGKSTSQAIGTIQEYLEKRQQQSIERHKPEIETVEAIEVPMEEDEEEDEG